jgi:hypothetical protein
MRLFELLRLADQLFEVRRQWRGWAHARKLLHLAYILASLSLGGPAAAFPLPQIAQGKDHVRRRLLAPISEQIGNVAEAGLAELVESPSGSGDDAPRDPGPVDL